MPDQIERKCRSQTTPAAGPVRARGVCLLLGGGREVKGKGINQETEKIPRLHQPNLGFH